MFNFIRRLKFKNYLKKNYLFNNISSVDLKAIDNITYQSEKGEIISDLCYRYPSLEDIAFDREMLKKICEEYYNPKLWLLERYYENGINEYSSIFIVESKHGILMPMSYINHRNPDIAFKFNFIINQQREFEDFKSDNSNLYKGIKNIRQYYCFNNNDIESLTFFRFPTNSFFSYIDKNGSNVQRSLEVILKEYKNEYSFTMYFNNKILKTSIIKVDNNNHVNGLAIQIDKYLDKFLFPYNLTESDYRQMGYEKNPEFTKKFVDMMETNYKSVFEMIRI